MLDSCQSRHRAAQTALRCDRSKTTRKTRTRFDEVNDTAGPSLQEDFMVLKQARTPALPVQTVKREQ